MASLRRRLGTALHVPGDLRHGLRQVSGRRGGDLPQDGHHHGVHKPRRLARGLEIESARRDQVLSRSPVSELPGVRGVSLRHGRRGQEGTPAQAGALRSARPDAMTGPVETAAGAAIQLELDDIQHFLVTRTPALAARYEFLSFPDASKGRAWLATMVEKVGSAKAVGSERLDSRWVTIGLTAEGLRSLGVNEASLATFPEEFRQGMAARASILATTGANHPDHWVGDLTSPKLHAIVILFAKDVAERERCKEEHQRFLERCGVEAISSLDLAAIPPLYVPDWHFGYRDRLSHPAIEGTGAEPTPGSGPPVKAGEFFLGYPDGTGLIPALPQPEILSRNGSFLAYLRLQEH